MATTKDYKTACRMHNGEGIELFFVNGAETSGQMFDGFVITEIPDGKYGYFVRHKDDEWSDPESVKKEMGFTVNFMGTLVTDKPIDFGDKDELIIEDWDWLYD